MRTRPRYRDLPELAPGYRHAWATAEGEAKVAGTYAWRSDDVAATCRLVRDGKVFALDLPVDAVPAAIVGRRQPSYHCERTPYGRDDWLGDYFLQGGTQWDGLRHIRFRQFGYFGGLQEKDLDSGDALGIDRVARSGVVSRGVLVDLATRSRRLDPARRTAISVADVERALDEQGTTVAAGDVLLLRTGWLRWFLQDPERACEGVAVSNLECIGLAAGEDVAEWIWDSGIIGVATDTPTVEAMPIRKEEGFLHHRLVALLGILLGEFWDLEELAGDCAADGRYDGLLVSTPLNVPGAAGSPANALFLK